MKLVLLKETYQLLQIFSQRLHISILLIIVVLHIIWIFVSCEKSSDEDARLIQIMQTVSDCPKEAIDSLKSINRSELSKSDRELYDFLSIKAADKAYITHTSDTLILKVIENESKHPEEGRYAEALYYGGRVYSDLGDYPTALDFFHRSLELLKKDAKQLKLRSTVQSQTGRLLNVLRLYKEAIPLLESSIEIERQINDSINEVYDLQLLGSIYLRGKDYMTAEKYFSIAKEKSKKLGISHYAKSCMYLAEVKYNMGLKDSALLYIRNTPNNVNSNVRNLAIAYAIKIYNSVGITDTAYMYSQQLIAGKDKNNKKTGYKYILQKQIRNRVSADTIYKYFSDYLDLLDSYYDDNANHFAVNQQTRYNYYLHDQAREKAEERSDLLWKWIVGCGIGLLILFIIILFLQYRNVKYKIRLQQAFIHIDNLKISSDNNKLRTISPHVTPSYDNNENKVGPLFHPDEVIHNDRVKSVNIDLTQLRAMAQQKLLNLYESHKNSIKVDSIIENSAAYKELKKRIENKQALPTKDKLWKEIEDIVLKSSPNFMDSLRLLAGGKLSSFDWETCLLIKCGVSPTQLSDLLSKAKGTIGSRRESIVTRMFDNKVTVKELDSIIILL